VGGGEHGVSFRHDQKEKKESEKKKQGDVHPTCANAGSHLGLYKWGIMLGQGEEEKI